MKKILASLVYGVLIATLLGALLAGIGVVSLLHYMPDASVFVVLFAPVVVCFALAITLPFGCAVGLLLHRTGSLNQWSSTLTGVVFGILLAPLWLMIEGRTELIWAMEGLPTYTVFAVSGLVAGWVGYRAAFGADRSIVPDMP